MGGVGGRRCTQEALGHTDHRCRVVDSECWRAAATFVHDSNDRKSSSMYEHMFKVGPSIRR